MSRDERLKHLYPLLKLRILLLDGAMGTMIQRHKLDEAAYRGKRFADWPSDLKGNNDLLTLTQPEIIQGIHKAYLDAGADIVETNTFNSTSVAMADYTMEELAYELNVEAAKLARAAADFFNFKHSEITLVIFRRPNFSANSIACTKIKAPNLTRRNIDIVRPSQIRAIGRS